MIADVKPYPQMKDSGVPWLGEVPEHWEVRRLKHAFRKIVGGSTPASTEPTYWDGDVVWVTPADISRTARLATSLRRITSEGLRSCSSELVPPGSIVVTSRAPVGNVAIAETELCTNQGCKALVATAAVVNPVFGFHVLTTLKGELQSLAAGTTFTEISTSRLCAVAIPLPPLPEQAAIVRFLDHADRRIRRYIRAKQKLIKLLEEQKQAIIHRAVTRGLDPNVRLRPSGVEWLGDVPEHWEVNQVRSIAKVVRGGSPRPAGSPVYFHGTGAPWITVGEVTRTQGKYVTGTTTRLTAAGEARSRTIEPGTLLLTNSGATLGIPKISAIRGCINDGVAAFLDLRPRIGKEFLLHYLATQTVHLKAWVDLGAQPNLNTQIIGGWPVPIPPPEEQVAISDRIEQSTTSIVDAANAAQREVDLLREYRTRLIADVVTGKLDVREAAARLPQEAEHLEPLDEAEVEGNAEESEAGDGDGVPEEVET